MVRHFSSKASSSIIDLHLYSSPVLSVLQKKQKYLMFLLYAINQLFVVTLMIHYYKYQQNFAYVTKAEYFFILLTFALNFGKGYVYTLRWNMAFTKKENFSWIHKKFTTPWYFMFCALPRLSTVLFILHKRAISQDTSKPAEVSKIISHAGSIHNPIPLQCIPFCRFS